MKTEFNLQSDYTPRGDQPEAIKDLVEGVNSGSEHQVLLGVTGSGKTFTIANVIAQTNRPTLVLSHNKTLAAQLYSEFKAFFPDNLVEYFVSYYDYYQPEAFIPSSGTEFHRSVIELNKGMNISRNALLHLLVSSLYSRTQLDLVRGSFRVQGDTVDVYLAYADQALRISFWGDEIEDLHTIDPESGKRLHSFDTFKIYPANLFVSSKENTDKSVWEIQQDLEKQKQFFIDQNLEVEASRLEERTLYDLEMIKELGYCSGIENYSRYFDRRQPGERPFCLLDYFPNDFLLVVDESHVTIPQIGAMYGGDRSRKINLVEHGFRLPSALDNRPLTSEEFNKILNQCIYVSATPADVELARADGVIVEQVIRPTGLLDPPIDVRPCTYQVDDLVEEIKITVCNGDRVLVTTLTKRMAEELTKYLERINISTRYIHSEVKTLERVAILKDLREGEFDVLVGVNLLREGLDLPEVSLVAIMDADKEGFLRSKRSLTQTAGRAARNVNGRVIMYADKITDSMKQTIDETKRRRDKQEAHNKKTGTTPQQIKRENHSLHSQSQR